MTRIAVVSAGLSQPSSTRLLADQLAAAVGNALPDVEIDIIELRDLAHDITNHLLTGFPSAALRAVLGKVEAADALIAVTPLYRASYNGLFKSFFDVVDEDALRNKPVLLGATGGTARHSLAIEHAIRPLFSYLHALTVPTAVFAATSDWGTDDALGARVNQAGQELADLLTHRAAPAATDPFANPTPFEQLLHG
ncbi:FMN reductase [Cryptosporangium phraense]|uniref:NADPH-dependent FMN reductase n=1 Tax=Cryptosporangium phraense TaxID=2593070 RepID=A0A545ADW4_9ACTN|nr:FMN reductase [Cryptosporangium phraense]TQS39528.1 NADPH-dependent FMN reductase [Cryptosporangium phraense]